MNVRGALSHLSVSSLVRPVLDDVADAYETLEHRLKAVNERIAKLEAWIADVRPILAEYRQECVNGGPTSCYPCGLSEKWLDDLAAKGDS